MDLKATRGFLKSWFIYYGKPFGSFRLKKFYRPFIKPGMLFFDIGERLGNRTNIWLQFGARVVAADPQTVCIHFLQKRFGKKSNVSIIPHAIGRNLERKTLHICTLNPDVSTLSEPACTNWMHEAASFIGWDTSMEIETTSPDALVKQYGLPGFYKIDQEGYELNVLCGLSVPIPNLCFQIISVNKVPIEPGISKLYSLGNYDFKWSGAERLNFQLDKWTNKAGILDAINQYTKKIFSGDIYARLLQ